MDTIDRKQHWDTIYKTRPLNEVSWYQPIPETSLNLITASLLPKTSKIIDIGGGDSYLSDSLLEMGYENITVLDISAAALQRAKKRLGPAANRIQWIEADASTFSPQIAYDIWHDRAAFHFLRDKNEIMHYVKAASKGVKPGGYLIIGTFGPNGPLKCSGIEIMQYSKEQLIQQFAEHFEPENCMYIDHTTPSGSIQQFTFCRFKRKEELV
jgi:SAM-dependent methyltransferase